MRRRIRFETLCVRGLAAACFAIPAPSAAAVRMPGATKSRCAMQNR